MTHEKQRGMTWAKRIHPQHMPVVSAHADPESGRPALNNA